jgi:hypothetical protein
VRHPMKDTVRVCQLNDESEAEIVRAILDEQSIPCVIRKMEDAAYDGIYVAQGPYAFIESPRAYYDSIQQIVADVRESRTVDVTAQTRKPVSRRDRTFFVIEAAAAVLLVGAIAYLGFTNRDLRKQVDRYSNRSTMSWAWDPSQKAAVGTDAATGRLRYTEYDRNFNNRYEEIVSYAPDGKSSTTSYDRNENGIVEETMTKNNDGTVIARGYDTNEDGFNDRELARYGASRSLEYLDTDKDRIFDRVVVHEGSRETTRDIRSLFFEGQP